MKTYKPPPQKSHNLKLPFLLTGLRRCLLSFHVLIKPGCIIWWVCSWPLASTACQKDFFVSQTPSLSPGNAGVLFRWSKTGKRGELMTCTLSKARRHFDIPAGSWFIKHRHLTFFSPKVSFFFELPPFPPSMWWTNGCCSSSHGAAASAHSSTLPPEVLSGASLGTGFRTGPICISPAYLRAASFAGQIKMRKTLQPSAVPAEDGQYAARCRQALLRNLLPACAQHGRWAIPGRAEPGPFFSFHTSVFSLCITAVFTNAGLQRAAVAVIGQEITHLQRWGWIQRHTGAPEEIQYTG